MLKSELELPSHTSVLYHSEPVCAVWVFYPPAPPQRSAYSYRLICLLILSPNVSHSWSQLLSHFVQSRRALVAATCKGSPAQLYKAWGHPWTGMAANCPRSNSVHRLHLGLLCWSNVMYGLMWSRRALAIVPHFVIYMSACVPASVIR